MELAQARSYRNLLGKLAAVCCFLALAAVLDGIVAKFREPVNVVSVLPGAVTEVNGSTDERVKTVADLEHVVSSPHLRLTLEQVHAGYFLGGRMWRGRLEVAPDTPPGKYSLAVAPKIPTPGKIALVFRVNVYADEASLREHSVSLVYRFLGFPPWQAAALLLPAILLGFALVFWMSWIIDRSLAAAGRAEIYKVTRGDGVFDIAFGLGSEHGVKAGDHLPILDPEGRVAGTVEVAEAMPRDAVGTVPGDHEVKVGYFVTVGAAHGRVP